MDKKNIENEKEEGVKEVNMKTIKFVLQKSEELEKRQLLISYFCLLYAVEKLNLYLKKNTSDKETKELFLSCLTKAEKLRPTFSNLDKEELATFCKKLFLIADKSDRTEKITKKTLQLFFTSQIFYEILNHFKTLDEDEKKKYIYAKYKTVYIKKCFDSNITPRPGTPTDDKDSTAEDISNIEKEVEESWSYKNEQTDTPLYVDNQNSLSPKEETDISNYKTDSINNKEDSSIDFAASMKHAQYAVNALMFEDRETSIKELKLALSYLE